MGIAKSQFNSILKNIFAEGHVIKLFSTVPSEQTETGGVTISGAGYEDYKIKDGDFEFGSGSVESASNMMMYLCEAAAGHGTAYGFGVFSGSEMLYFGSFTEPMVISYNTVPTIKRYNGAGEGIKITMTSTEVSV